MGENTTRKTIKTHAVGQSACSVMREVSGLGAFEDE